MADNDGWEPIDKVRRPPKEPGEIKSNQEHQAQTDEAYEVAKNSYSRTLASHLLLRHIPALHGIFWQKKGTLSPDWDTVRTWEYRPNADGVDLSTPEIRTHISNRLNQLISGEIEVVFPRGYRDVVEGHFVEMREVIRRRIRDLGGLGQTQDAQVVEQWTNNLRTAEANVARLRREKAELVTQNAQLTDANWRLRADNDNLKRAVTDAFNSVPQSQPQRRRLATAQPTRLTRQRRATNEADMLKMLGVPSANPAPSAVEASNEALREGMRREQQAKATAPRVPRFPTQSATTAATTVVTRKPETAEEKQIRLRRERRRNQREAERQQELARQRELERQQGASPERKEESPSSQERFLEDTKDEQIGAGIRQLYIF